MLEAIDVLQRVSFSPIALRLEWLDGDSYELASIWLRDNCPGDRDSSNGQRLIDVTQLPEAPRIRSVSVREDTILVEWDDQFAADYTVAWLDRHRPSRLATRDDPEHWLEGAQLSAERDFAWLPLGELQASPVLRVGWLTRLLRRGVGFLSTVATSPGAILGAVAQVGQVLDTNYGRVFDVRAVAQPENLAYSDAGLGLHTDNPYRDPVPGFQALHCLVASPDGGENIFADGFAIAEHLRSVDAKAFAVLTQTLVPFHYRAKNADLYCERPLIRLAPSGAVEGVHYNSRSIAPLPFPAAAAEEFYAAYRRFAMLLREERFQLHVKLRPGDLVVFDNQRVLHGRSAYTSARYERHLQGCYLSRDSVLSAAAVLRREFGTGGAR
jgi:gamma-butyrobetaine dioxygenase